MVSGPFYGFRGFVLYGVGDNLPQNQPYVDPWEILVTRLDQDLNEVATWWVDDAYQGELLFHMRDFAITPDGIYELTFPSHNIPTDFSMLVDNMLETSDVQVIGIAFDGGITNIEVGVDAYGSGEGYSPVNSLQEVRNSDGAVYWQDQVNNVVWTKIRGGAWSYYDYNPATEPPPTFEDETYEVVFFT